MDGIIYPIASLQLYLSSSPIDSRKAQLSRKPKPAAKNNQHVTPAFETTAATLHNITHPTKHPSTIAFRTFKTTTKTTRGWGYYSTNKRDFTRVPRILSFHRFIGRRTAADRTFFLLVVAINKNATHHRRVLVFVLVRYRQPSAQQELRRCRRPRTRCRMKGSVTVSVQRSKIGLVHGEEFETAQKAFSVTGNVEGGLPELVSAVDVQASLLQQLSDLWYIFCCAWVCLRLNTNLRELFFFDGNIWL